VIRKKKSWLDPLHYVKSIPDNEVYWTFLYSGLSNNFTGRYSYLAIYVNDQTACENFQEFARKYNTQDKWFGYLSYDLKNSLEELPVDEEFIIKAPKLWMVNYKCILTFDHIAKEITIEATDEFHMERILNSWPTNVKPLSSTLEVGKLKSTMTKNEYIGYVKEIKNKIYEGKIYQANLTRKFYTTIAEGCNYVDLFIKLAIGSPAPYSAFLKFRDLYVISSSPEQFLKIDEAGKVFSRPIKGTIGRGKNPQEDEKKKFILINSEKDRAENLMITDLMRNDFSRGAEKGTVNVEGLYELSTYAALHHLSSTVTAMKKGTLSSLAFVMNCFPPGSMTGAPKIKAMKVCANIEKYKRGIYSGCIGWMSSKEDMAEFSVVIRTVIIQGNKLEFQVGGAIVADSDPEKEWQETLSKAMGIVEALGININEVARL
jgi:para-aminobenzoate synthetase component I